MSFDTAIEHVRLEEKGFVNHPKDPGKATNYGITQATLTAAIDAFHDLDLPELVQDLSWPQAKEIYRRQFWQVIRGDELPSAIALAVLDGAVNSSPKRAVEWLQRALGVGADGWVGVMTIGAAKRCDLPAVLLEFSARRAWHYMLQDDIDDAFGLGWARRLFRTHNAAMKEIHP